MEFEPDACVSFLGSLRGCFLKSCFLLQYPFLGLWGPFLNVFGVQVRLFFLTAIISYTKVLVYGGSQEPWPGQACLLGLAHRQLGLGER